MAVLLKEAAVFYFFLMKDSVSLLILGVIYGNGSEALYWKPAHKPVLGPASPPLQKYPGNV